MASKAAEKRLRREFAEISKKPPPYVRAKPLEKDILQWYFVIDGPPDSPYTGGRYMGRLIFPKEYPFKPPGIMMVTPNGRFKLDTRICMSMSDYHPETWNPLWNI